MNLAKLIEFLRDRLKAVKLVCIGVLVLLAALDIVFVSREHAHTEIEHIPAFWSIFGFIGCAVLILVSKWYGHLGIMTREDYYEDACSGVRPSSGAATSASGRALEHSNTLAKSKGAAPEDGRTPEEHHE